MSKINLEIITPEKIVYQDNNVNLVCVPSSTGQLGILPDHVPLFSKLTEGELKIEIEGKEDIFLAIGGGFLEVNNNKVTVLVTRAVNADEINEKEATEAQNRAKKILEEKPEGEDLLTAQNIYRRSLIDLKVIRRRRPSVNRPSSNS